MDTKVKAYICSPLSAETEQEIQQNMEFTKNDCFSGIKNNLCQISTLHSIDHSHK